MIRKILFFAAAVLVAVPACAQKMHRSEVSVSYGFAPITNWIDAYSDQLTGLFSGSDTSLTGWGVVTAGYNFRLLGGLSLGAEVAYSSNRQKVKHVGSTIKTRYWTLMPNVKWNWLNLKIMTFYTRIGAGAAFSKSKVDGHEDTATKFAFQVSPIGLEVGGRLAAYAEAGIGTSGCFQVGVRYRF